jgi:GTP-binding protein
MKIKSAEFLISNTNPDLCPEANRPEYAFIGRSNVGKSSLINMLCERKALAKTSSTPGKTQLINHFLINENWYLVDLPGYGYAKASRQERNRWDRFIKAYLFKRSNLMYTFVLVDARHKPQQIDLDFIEMLGIKKVPFIILFTKIDKLSSSVLNKNLMQYKKELLKQWEELPLMISTSSVSGIGKEEVHQLIEQTNLMFQA